MDRTPGQGRYVQIEREQRWVLRELPDGLVAPVSITDRYLTGTRLRLRMMQSDSHDPVYKLGQKVRPDKSSPAVVKLTTMYLDEDEYARLRRLPGHELRKTRRRMSGAARSDLRGLAVDEFHDHLIGLVLAELDLGADRPAMDHLGLAAIEVTTDDRFSGGALAAATAAQVQELLDSVARRW